MPANYYELPLGSLDDLVQNALEGAREVNQAILTERAKRVVKNYEGRDIDAMSVIIYASQQGKLEKYLDKLEEHYNESMRFVHPSARRVSRVPGAVRAEAFFIDCFKEMGIQPRANSA